MKKVFLFITLAVMTSVAHSKSTYIPTYMSYIHIKDGTDTTSTTNNLHTLSMTDKSGTFRVSVVHEDVTRERIKAIKRNKAAAGWMQIAAIGSSVSSVSNALSGDYGIASLGITNASLANVLSSMYHNNASAAEILGMEIWVDNLKDEELIVADIDRGLVWYVQPRQTVQISVKNPDVTHLRISDVHSRHVQLVTTAGGSSLRKEYINYEDEECWVVEVWQGEGSASRIAYYEYIDKKTFEKRPIFIEAIEDFRNSRRNSKQ